MFDLESIAMALALLLHSSLFKEAHFFVFSDNQAAVKAFNAGSSDSPLVDYLIAWVHYSLVRAGSKFTLSWIPSFSNPADLTSRVMLKPFFLSLFGDSGVLSPPQPCIAVILHQFLFMGDSGHFQPLGQHSLSGGPLSTNFEF